MTTSIDDLWSTNTTYEMGNATATTGSSSENGKIYIPSGSPGATYGTWTNRVPTSPGSPQILAITITPDQGALLKTSGTATVTVTYRPKFGGNEVLTQTVGIKFNTSTDTSFDLNVTQLTLLSFGITDGIFKGQNLILAPPQAHTETTGQSINGWDKGFPSEIKCFLFGTEIETPTGIRLVEDLKVNDEIIVVDKNKKIIRKIKSILSKKVIVNGSDQFPIRILKSAISDNVPYKDLLVTPEHCLLIDKQFIPVRMLVNGRSIIQDVSYNSYDIFHFETDEHSVVIANGVLTESYLDTDFSINENMTVKGGKSWNIDSAFPLNTFRVFAEHVYKNIENRAKALNIPDGRTKNTLTNDYGFYLTTSTGETISFVSQHEDSFIFRLPPNVNQVTLHSNSSRPSDVIGPFVDDRRYLGILVGNITLCDQEGAYTIETHFDTNQLRGWSVIEQEKCRWTCGKADLSLNRKNIDSIAVLKITVLDGGPYLVKNQTDEEDIKKSLVANLRY